LNEIYKTGEFGELINNEPGVIFNERRALSIVQVSAWEDQLEATMQAIEKTIGIKPPDKPCISTQSSESNVIWIAPSRWLIIEKEQRDLFDLINQNVTSDMAAITDQSHSRCVIRLSGKETRNVLRKGCSLDLDDAHFKINEAKTTNLFHMNALIHCSDENSFDIYVARSFGQSFFEVITHAAAEYGYRVEEAI
jgi:heterotetrameric sarcosine oxidase gamma subunit